LADKPWKQAERNAARVLRTNRTPLSGGASRQTRSDTLHKRIYLEVKYRQRFAVVELIRKEEVKAKKEGKTAILCLQQRGLKTRYYVIPEWMMKLLSPLL
jgi:hypothetical protein